MVLAPSGYKNAKTQHKNFQKWKKNDKNAKTFAKTVKNVLILAKSVIVFVVLAVHNLILPKNAEQRSIWYIGYVGYYRQ
jgi:uncharacterized ion transporter superfamily protein YfcC